MNTQTLLPTYRGMKMKSLLGIALLLIQCFGHVGRRNHYPPKRGCNRGNGSGDIQAALDAAGSDDHAKIRLTNGTFYLNGGVGVTGFRGTLVGAGKDKTEMIALDTGDPDNRYSVLLFVNGDATIKDLSIVVPDGSHYLDSNPGLFVSDGGAAIDIFGGSAMIQNVGIMANGPFRWFGDDSLETGVLLHNCDGNFKLKNTSFEGVKRAVILTRKQNRTVTSR